MSRMKVMSGIKAGSLTAALAMGLLAACERPAPPGKPIAGTGESAPAGAASTRGPDSGGVLPRPAAVPVPPASEPTPSAADLEAGARLATEGAGAVPACNSCHGARGEGQPAERAPRLAGLGAAYLRQQLEAYASGARRHPVMEPIAQALQAAPRHQVAAHFASLDLPAMTPGAGRPPADGIAAKLAWTGDEARQLMACANCHGRDGGGLGDRIPPLAGQPASYLEAALAAWRDGRRRTDPSGQMPRIARALQAAEVRALAAWYAALPVPPPAARQAPAFVPSLPATNAGPVMATSPARGLGSEQGAALTGGSVGPGGAGATQQMPSASGAR